MWTIGIAMLRTEDPGVDAGENPGGEAAGSGAVGQQSASSLPKGSPESWPRIALEPPWERRMTPSVQSLRHFDRLRSMRCEGGENSSAPPRCLASNLLPTRPCNLSKQHLPDPIRASNQVVYPARWIAEGPKQIRKAMLAIRKSLWYVVPVVVRGSWYSGPGVGGT